MSWDESRERVASAHADLCSSGLLVPVGHDEYVRSWQNHDIASFVEHRLGFEVDPLDLEAPLRNDLIRRATDEYELRLSRPADVVPYWIRAGQDMVGTVALATASRGSGSISVSSLYISRDQRRRGHASRLIRAVSAAAQRSGLFGIDLNTSWCWQPAVALYLSQSMWVKMWKRDLKLVHHFH